MPRIPLKDMLLCTVDEARALVERANVIREDRNRFDHSEEPFARLMIGERTTLNAYLVAMEVAVDTGDPHLLAAALDGARKAHT